MPHAFVRRHSFFHRAGGVVLMLGLCAIFSAPLSAAERKALIFTKSSGFQHEITKRDGMNPSPAERILDDLVRGVGLIPVFSKNGQDIRAEYLAEFDVVIFYTTGDLNTISQNGTELAVGDNGKTELLTAIRSGHIGFIGIHSASDTWHSEIPGVKRKLQRYQSAGQYLDPYLAMLGAEFIGHDSHGPGSFKVTDPTFPHLTYQTHTAMALNEWYALKDFSPEMHVLMTLDTEATPGPKMQRGSFPITWVRKYGEGRVFYTALGHGMEDWNQSSFRDLLLGALLWTSGQVNVDTTPNIFTVAPRSGEIAPPQPKK